MITIPSTKVITTAPATILPARPIPAKKVIIPQGSFDETNVKTIDTCGIKLEWVPNPKLLLQSVEIMGSGAAIPYNPNWAAADAVVAIKTLLGLTGTSGTP